MTRFVDRLTGFLKYKTKVQEMPATFSCNLSRKKYCIASCEEVARSVAAVLLGLNSYKITASHGLGILAHLFE